MAGTTLNIRNGENRPAFETTLKDLDGSPVDLTNADRARFRMQEFATCKLLADGDCEFLDRGEGKVRYSWQAGDTDRITHSPRTVGHPHVAEIEVTFSDGHVRTFPPDDYYEIKIFKSLG